MGIFYTFRSANYAPPILLSAKSNADNYIDAVRNCGCMATVADLSETDTHYDGLILCRGGDIHPKYYGEKVDSSENIDIARDEIEFTLVKAFIEAGKPILGIYRGLQILNDYFGGTLHQNRENSCKHSSFADFDLIHSVHASEESVFEKMYGTNFTVNSSHHQSIRKLGNGLRATLVTTDGAVVEGIEHESLPVLAVQ